MLRLRKSVNSLTAAEKADLISAIKALKANGTYDRYIVEHDNAMNQATLMPGENPPPPQFFYRNVAHRGPAFGPWHRELLRRFELDLQAQVPGVTLPYWDWAADSQLADPTTAPIWGPDLMGGDGNPNNQGLVDTGPFRYDPNDPTTWRVVTSDGDPGPGLRRTLGQGGHLPSQDEIDLVLEITPYDSSPWRTVSNPSFRNQLEGWQGPNLHNSVHVWVGGSMLPGTSPNDPVFFLHHCNVDRLWWNWQRAHPDAVYVPTSGGPPGHNLNDQMSPWDSATTPASTLAIDQLGYRYDTDPPT
jgi:tyrosinase